MITTEEDYLKSSSGIDVSTLLSIGFSGPVIRLSIILSLGFLFITFSSIVKWGYQDIFKPVYFFLQKDFVCTKVTKT